MGPSDFYNVKLVGHLTIFKASFPGSSYPASVTWTAPHPTPAFIRGQLCRVLLSLLLPPHPRGSLLFPSLQSRWWACRLKAMPPVPWKLHLCVPHPYLPLSLLLPLRRPLVSSILFSLLLPSRFGLPFRDSYKSSISLFLPQTHAGSLSL